ncbi:MAG: winged helix-turn-helix domain-containing protein [Bacteroidaceae bacterium]|nr:winged helix-turn-helix domain-containing protein [Bacteroidaceae bacterium]
MMFEKAGELAGAVWTALNENGAMNAKDLKKAAKAKTEKDLYLALGWLLREDKLSVAGDEKEPTFSLK